MRYTETIEAPDNWTELELHPLCTCFPEMSADEFAKLRKSIQGMGLRLPIVLFEGMILDGRHRHRVCVEEGIEPFFEEYRGPGSPSDFVYDTNLHRRDLTVAQKIEATIALREVYVAWAEERRAAGLKRGTVRAPVPELENDTIPLAGRSRDHFAEAIGTSGRTVSDAFTVRDRDPEERQRVLAGEKSIKAAAREVRERAKPSLSSITLDAWKALSTDERAEALKPTKSTTLNK